jgi:hypothetical protein
MSRSGFSIAELLVAVVVLAIIGVVFVGSHSGLDDRIALEIGVSEVVSALRFARSESMRTGEVHGARVESSTGRIRVYRLDISASPPVEVNDVYHPVDKKLYDVVLGGRSFARGVRITSSQFRFGGDPSPYESVAFERSGLPVSSFDLKLMDSGNVGLDFRGISAAVTLDPQSGRVSTS